MDRRQFWIIAILLSVIGTALLVLILVLVLSSSDDEPAVAPPPPPTTTPLPASTLPTPTLPPAPATTLPEPTLPPAPPTTPPTTLLPATTAATTTEAPPPATTTTETPPAPLILQDDGLGGVPFGTDPAVTISYAESVLGPAGNDTGWINSFSKYGTCPGPVVRGVEWGGDGSGYGFVLLFTEAATDHLPGGGQHLFGYSYFGDPGGLVTDGGITVGSTLGDALAAHPGSTVDEHPLVPGSGTWTVDPDPSDHSLLWGFANGIGAGDALTSVSGGVTCGE